MDQDKVLRDLSALPPMAQQLVIDFIAYLRLRYTREPDEENRALLALKDEPFVGMWRDCPDMADSNAWLRTVRSREWG